MVAIKRVVPARGQWGKIGYADHRQAPFHGPDTPFFDIRIRTTGKADAVPQIRKDWKPAHTPN
jgi:hypothetical protein